MSIFSKILNSTLNRLPLKNIIVFESEPDLSDNTKAVFDEFVQRGFNKKYKLVWMVTEKKKTFPKIKNVYYVKNLLTKSIFWKFVRLIINTQAKCFIACNRYLASYRPGQTAIYLTHGTPIKSMTKYTFAPQNIDWCYVASENMKELYAKEKKIDINKMIGLGYPRNDKLNSHRDVKSILQTQCKKIIVWYPTYRQNKHKKSFNTNTNSVPLLHNTDYALKLNECAKNNDTLIVLKPHFAQDLSFIKNIELSNIVFIDDSFFEKNNITSYEFVGNCDALITDYSSVYYDYTLCNKPIAVIWSDIDEYRTKPGFAVDLDFYLKGAEKIYTLEDFTQFLHRISHNIDTLKNERNEIKEFANYSTDGKNTMRVVDDIIKRASL